MSSDAQKANANGPVPASASGAESLGKDAQPTLLSDRNQIPELDEIVAESMQGLETPRINEQTETKSLIQNNDPTNTSREKSSAANKKAAA